MRFFRKNTLQKRVFFVFLSHCAPPVPVGVKESGFAPLKPLGYNNNVNDRFQIGPRSRRRDFKALHITRSDGSHSMKQVFDSQTEPDPIPVSDQLTPCPPRHGSRKVRTPQRRRSQPRFSRPVARRIAAASASFRLPPASNPSSPLAPVLPGAPAPGLSDHLSPLSPRGTQHE